MPTSEKPNSDVQNLDFVTIERPRTMSVSGSIFFEGEQTVKQYKSLYKEAPAIHVAIHRKGDPQPLQSMQLPISHLFEFKGLKRGEKYELVVKGSKPIVDRRHESLVNIDVEDKDDSSFVKVILPLKGKAPVVKQ